MKLRYSSHLIFFILAILCFGFAVFPTQNALDIAVHDTYFVVNNNHIYLLFGSYFLICSVAYFLIDKFKRKKIKVLHGIHVLTSIFAFVIIIFSLLNVGIQGAPKPYYDYSVYGEFDKKSAEIIYDFNIILTIVIILFLIAQVIFLVNIIIGFTKRNS